MYPVNRAHLSSVLLFVVLSGCSASAVDQTSDTETNEETVTDSNKETEFDSVILPAAEALEVDPHADFFQYNSRIYSKIPEGQLPAEENAYSKETLLGKIIERSNNGKAFKDFHSTKLPEGTAIYSPMPEGEPAGILIAETPVTDIFYRFLPAE